MLCALDEFEALARAAPEGGRRCGVFAGLSLAAAKVARDELVGVISTGSGDVRRVGAKLQSASVVTVLRGWVGCEISHCPTSVEPSESSAAIVVVLLVLMAGKTWHSGSA